MHALVRSSGCASRVSHQQRPTVCRAFPNPFGGAGAKAGKGKDAAAAKRNLKDKKREAETYQESSVPVVIEPFSIDKCLNLYLSVFRWMQGKKN